MTARGQGEHEFSIHGGCHGDQPHFAETRYRNRLTRRFISLFLALRLCRRVT